MIKIRCKWNKQKLDVDVNPASVTATALKASLCALSGVPTERMKVMGKGLWKGVLKDATDISGAAWKEGQLISMMGTSTGVAILEKPTEEIKFVEDLTAKEQAMAGKVSPPGLANLGNTCYLNSAVQCLKAVPDLRESLAAYTPGAGAGLETAVTGSLKSLYEEMDSSLDAVTPFGFVASVRRAFPEFAQMSQRGGYEQQDSDEFLLRLLTLLKTSVTHKPASIADDDMFTKGNVVDGLFGLEFSEVLTCDECEAEPVQTKRGGELKDYKLTCNVEKEITHVNEGLLHFMNGQVEKPSEILGRQALWSVKKRVARLPKYLVIAFNRFYWKPTPDSRDHAGVNCKKVKMVSFNSTLDVFGVCDENLQRILKVQRDKLGDDILSGKDSAGKGLAGGGADVEMGDAPTAAAAAAEGGGAAAAGEGGDDELQKALAMSMEVEAGSSERCGVGLPANFRGLYGLFGVVTHKGRAANSGHYMGWTKQGESDDWVCFDDDGASECKEDYVTSSLKGGGDAHMAYLLFYKAKAD